MKQTGDVKRKFEQLKDRLCSVAGDDDEEVETVEDKYPNLPMSDEIKDILHKSRRGHDMELIKELTHGLAQNKGSCVLSSHNILCAMHIHSQFTKRNCCLLCEFFSRTRYQSKKKE